MEADADEALELGLGEDAELERALSREQPLLRRLRQLREARVERLARQPRHALAEGAGEDAARDWQQPQRRQLGKQGGEYMRACFFEGDSEHESNHYQRLFDLV